MTRIKCKNPDCVDGVVGDHDCPMCNGLEWYDVHLADESLYEDIEKYVNKLHREETIEIVEKVKKWFGVQPSMVIVDDARGNEHYGSMLELLKSVDAFVKGK